MDAESLTIHAWFTGEGGASRVRIYINPPHGDTLTTIVKINGVAQTPVSAEGIHDFDCAWGDEIEAYTEPHNGYVWRSYLAAINVVPSSQNETFLNQTIKFTALGNSRLYPMTDKLYIIELFTSPPEVAYIEVNGNLVSVGNGALLRFYTNEAITLKAIPENSTWFFVRWLDSDENVYSIEQTIVITPTPDTIKLTAQFAPMGMWV